MSNNGDLAEIIQFIKATRRFDAELDSSEKSLAVLRERIQLLNLDPQTYLDELQVRPGELDLLLEPMFDRRSIMQDPQLWQVLRDSVVPALVASPGQVRVWCVGCCDGIDAYAMAVLLAEATSASEFSERIKIFATDGDDNELIAARSGLYDREALSCLSDDILYRYFSPQANYHFAFRADLRRLIIFGKHSFLNDAPISRMDFVNFRYELAKQDLEKQQKSISRLLFSLNSGGHVLVGNGEGIPAGQGFQSSDVCPSLYKKIVRARVQFGELPAYDIEPTAKALWLQDTALDVCGPAQIVVDSFGVIALANTKARTTFGITAADLGKPLQEHEISYRPLELRSLIERIQREGGPIKMQNVTKVTADRPLHFEVLLKPLLDNSRLIGTSIQYIDVSEHEHLASQVNVLNEHLHAANEELHSAHEELVTTNEELQSTNEELETTNEELQSTNEELETMNEELRSTNNELESTNSAQRQLTEILEQSNSFLNSIVDSMNSAIIVLNPAFGVLVWNERAADLWGLRESEVLGQNFLSLDIGLPLDKLKSPLRSMAAGSTNQIDVEVAAINRRGKSINCRVRANPLSPSAPKGYLVLVQQLGKADGDGA